MEMTALLQHNAEGLSLAVAWSLEIGERLGLNPMEAKPPIHFLIPSPVRQSLTALCCGKAAGSFPPSSY